MRTLSEMNRNNNNMKLSDNSHLNHSAATRSISFIFHLISMATQATLPKYKNISEYFYIRM